MDESEWKFNLRFSKENFMELVHRLRPQLAPKPRSFRLDYKTAEKKLGMSLRYLKDQGSVRVTANAAFRLWTGTEHLPEGDSRIKRAGMLIGKFQLNP